MEGMLSLSLCIVVVLPLSLLPLLRAISLSLSLLLLCSLLPCLALFSTLAGAYLLRPPTRPGLSYIMARHRASYEHPGDDAVNEIIGNGSLSEHYLALARDLDVMEAKVRD